eukprot:1239383-Prymnesium_polylepis.1
MGGVGKTMLAAALACDEEVRAAFDKVCWSSVGQEPDTSALQQMLYRQLVNEPLPEKAKADEAIALETIKEAAKGLSVLLILDDLWDAKHARPLNFVDPLAIHSAVVVTTRIRSLLSGAAEVQCETLSPEASLELLLRTGGHDKLLSAPPPAVVEAVELCGRLPLVLGIAGGIIAELADDWESELLSLLKDQFQEASVEERVVAASLHAVPVAMRAAVEGVFALCGVFAEDAIVPAAATDLLAPLMPGDAALKQAAQKKLQVRRWLQQLLKANLVRGSIEDGVSVHDLVRDCMMQRADATGEGGLRGMQREAVRLLVDAFDAGGPAASYASASLQRHVRQARQPDVDVHADALLMGVLRHGHGAMRKQGALGVGVSELHDAADARDAAGEH